MQNDKAKIKMKDNIFIKHKKTTIVCAILLAIAAILFLHRTVKGYFPMPQGIRRLLYAALDNTGHKTRLVEDHFLLNKKGFQKTYDLDLKFIDTYTIGILRESDYFPGEFRYKGKIQADFYANGNKLFTKISDSSTTNYFFIICDMKSDPWKTAILKIGLIDFDVLINGKFYPDMTVTITVLEEDENLIPFQEDVKLYIGIDKTL